MTPATKELLHTTRDELHTLADTLTTNVSSLLALANKLEQALLPPSFTSYSQRDPRWRHYEYAPGYTPRCTLSRYGCYITAVATLASLAGYTDTPPQVAAKLKVAKALIGSQLNHPEYIPTAYPLLKWSGSLNWRNKPADIASLKYELKTNPIIIEVEFRPGGAAPPEDQHFVLAKSFTTDGKDLLVIDPWDGATTHLLERYALDHWDLARAIYGARLLKIKETT